MRVGGRNRREPYAQVVGGHQAENQQVRNLRVAVAVAESDMLPFLLIQRLSQLEPALSDPVRVNRVLATALEARIQVARKAGAAKIRVMKILSQAPHCNAVFRTIQQIQ